MANSTAARKVVQSIAALAGWAVAFRHDLVQHQLTEDECTAKGLPYGAKERAIHAEKAKGLSRWRIAAWIDAGPVECCLNLQFLGYWVEVFYLATRSALPSPAKAVL